MIILGLFVGLLTLLAAGAGVTLLLSRGVSHVNLLEGMALSWLFGTGAISLLLWAGGFAVSGVTLQSGVAVASVALLAAGITSARKRQVRFSFPRPANGVEWILTGAIAFEILAMVYGAFGHGLGWDGLLNWEAKARYAFLNNGVIPAAYYSSETHVVSHPGYPLLIPMTELWLYLAMGEPHQFWIKLIFPLYYAAGAILIATSGRCLTNQRWPGLAASALLFFVPFLTNSPGNATGGYVDVPLSVFYLAAIAYLLRYAMTGERFALRICAASLALLPWCKREGTILWFIAASCGAVVIWRSRDSWRQFFWLTPGPIIIVLWRTFLTLMKTTPTHEFLPMTLPGLAGNLGRLPPIGRMVIAEMMETTRWNLLWPCLGLAFICLAFRRPHRELAPLAVAVLAPIMIYAGSYVLSDWPDYSLHFGASFSRLLLHVVPVAFLAIGLAIARPAGVSLPPDTPHRSRTR